MRQHQSALAAALAAIVVSTLVGSVPTVAGPAQAAPASERASAQTTYQRTAFRVTNNKRERHDRAVLRRHDCLQKYAVRNARRMARTEHMGHQDLGPILRRCGMNLVGENVAVGYPNGRAVVRAWMRSPGHRENILRRQFKRMGLAARKGDDGRWYACQVFGRRA